MAIDKRSWMRGAGTLAMGGALALGACADRAELPEAVAMIDVDGVKAKDIAKRFSPKVHSVDEAEMRAALDLISASEPVATWESETFGDDSVTLTDVSVSGMTTGTMVFHGLRRAESDGLSGIAYDRFEARDIEIDFEAYTETLEAALGEDDLFGLPEDVEAMDVPPPEWGAEDRPAITPPIDLNVENPESDTDTDSVILPDVAADDTPARPEPARLRIANVYAVEGMSPAGEGALDAMMAMMEDGRLTGLPGELGPVVASGLELIDAEGGVMATLDSLAFADSDVGTRNGFFDMDGLRVEWDDEGVSHTVGMDEISLAGFPAIEPMMDAMMAFSARASAATWRSEVPEDAPAVPFDREAVLGALLLPYERASLENLSYSGFLDMAIPEMRFEGKRKGDRIDTDVRMTSVLDVAGSEEEVRSGFVDVFGSDRAEIEMGYSTRLDVADDVLEQTGRARLPDGFTLDYDYAAKGYVVLWELYADMMEAMMTSDDPERAIQGMAMQGFALADAFRIGKLDIAFTDDGLYGRLTDAAAEEEGVDPQTYRDDVAAGMVADFQDAMASSPIPLALAEDVVEAVAEFVREPGSTFRLTLEPDEPVTLMGVMSFSPERLGFSAETTR